MQYENTRISSDIPLQEALRLDRERVNAALREFARSISMMPSSWKVHFSPKGQAVRCNVYMYFANRKTLRARAVGKDEYTALENCLVKAGTVPRARALPSYALLGNG